MKTILAILTISLEEEKDLLVIMQMTFQQFPLKLNAMLTWVDTGTKHSSQGILMLFIIQFPSTLFVYQMQTLVVHPGIFDLNQENQVVVLYLVEKVLERLTIYL